jgi:RNA polymerase sigma factor (sigma-70 family)
LKATSRRTVADRPLKRAIEAAKPPRTPRPKTLWGGMFTVSKDQRPVRRFVCIPPLTIDWTIPRTHDEWLDCPNDRRPVRSNLKDKVRKKEPYDLALIRPIIRGFELAMPHNDVLLRIFSERVVAGHLGAIVTAAPDLRERLLASDIHRGRPFILDPNWSLSCGLWDIAHFPVEGAGLTTQQRQLVHDYRQYALKRAYRFWWKRTHFLNKDDRSDLFQVAYLELCLTAKTFNPELGFSFGTLIQKALSGAFHDWIRERWSVVHRSPEAWKRWRARYKGISWSWMDDPLLASIEPKQDNLADDGIVGAARKWHSHENLQALTTTGWQAAESCLTPRELEVFRARCCADQPASQNELATQMGIRPDSVSALEVQARKKFAEAARLMLADKWQK